MEAIDVIVSEECRGLQRGRLTIQGIECLSRIKNCDKREYERKKAYCLYSGLLDSIATAENQLQE